MFDSLSTLSWTKIFPVAATLFFIMDPLGNTPIFNSILKKFSTKERVKIICRELIFALVILLGFLYTGTTLLSFLGLSQPSLNLAGGILLFIIALRMLFPNKINAEEETIDDPFIVPLAMPLIAGPSTIAVLLLMSSSEPERMAEWSISLLIAWSATAAILILSPFFIKYLGKRGITAIERLMGMLLILIAIQMFLNGLTQYVKSLMAS